jgi:hypothetical protein
METPKLLATHRKAGRHGRGRQSASPYRWTRSNGRRIEPVWTPKCGPPDGLLDVHRHFIELQPSHTHFIELQSSHTLEQVPFPVLAEQGWNVSEACRLFDDAAHPTRWKKNKSEAQDRQPTTNEYDTCNGLRQKLARTIGRAIENGVSPSDRVALTLQ